MGREEPCKHVWAVRYVIERESRPETAESVQEPSEPATLVFDRKATTAPRPTYKQDWPAYNAAQVNEKAKFLGLLSDLCRGLPEPERKPGRGKAPLRPADLVFAAFKVYSTFSGRRFMTDLRDAHEHGHSQVACSQSFWLSCCWPCSTAP